MALAGDARGRIGSWQSGEGWKPREVVTKTEPEMHSHRELLQGVDSFTLAPSSDSCGDAYERCGAQGGDACLSREAGGTVGYGGLVVSPRFWSLGVDRSCD